MPLRLALSRIFRGGEQDRCDYPSAQGDHGKNENYDPVQYIMELYVVTLVFTLTVSV
jgi:hypothetical protein